MTLTYATDYWHSSRIAVGVGVAVQHSEQRPVQRRPQVSFDLKAFFCVAKIGCPLTLERCQEGCNFSGVCITLKAFTCQYSIDRSCFSSSIYCNVNTLLRCCCCFCCCCCVLIVCHVTQVTCAMQTCDTNSSYVFVWLESIYCRSI